MKRIRFTLFVALCMFSYSFGFNGDLGTTTDPSADGSESNPWLIEDLADFNAFCNDSDRWAYGVYTRMECDLEMSSVGVYTHSLIAWDTDYSNTNFDGVQYQGAFIGNGHSISDITIISEEGSYLGLFGEIGPEGRVSGLVLENLEISGYCRIGGICGINYGKISQSVVTGSITCLDYFAGGVAGICYSGGMISECNTDLTMNGVSRSGGICGTNLGTIYRSYSLGNVFGEEYTGGICGINNTGIVEQCYSKGIISGSDYTGGICGKSSGTINQCYSLSRVDGDGDTGGICGYCSGLFSECYFAGTISAPHLYGGLFLYAKSSNMGKMCFWDTDTTHLYGIDLNSVHELYLVVGLGLKTEMLKKSVYYDAFGWSADTWVLPENDYPHFIWENVSGEAIAPTALAGSGTEIDPYKISSVNDLVYMGIMENTENIYYVQTKNIDMSGYVFSYSVVCPQYYHDLYNYNFTESYPGYPYVVFEFNGHYNGNTYSISNLVINAEYPINRVGALPVIGLFSGIGLNGSVTGVNLIDFEMFSNVEAGGLCCINNGNIEQCHISGKQTGWVFNSGFCYINNGNIENCICICDIMINESPLSHIPVAGFCYKNNSEISNSFFIGTIDAAVDYRYVFNFSNPGTIQNCFWDSDVAGVIGSNGGTGLTTAQMQSRSTFTDSGWDFNAEDVNGSEDVWHMPYQGQGYPMLWYQRDIPGDSVGSYGITLADFADLAVKWQDSADMSDLELIAQYWMEGL